jgi:hypothetical protein
MAAPMRQLAEVLKSKRPHGRAVKMFVVHQEAKTPVPTQALAPGVRALSWRDFVTDL